MKLPRLLQLLAQTMLLSWGLAVLAAPAHAVLPIEHWTTRSGARVLFVHAPSIPMLDLAIGFDAGSRRDPAGLDGLASFTHSMLGRGTGDLDESAVADRFAALGAELGGSLNDDRAVVSLRTLVAAAQLEPALDLFARLLSAPRFDEEVIERERERSLQALREAMVKPDYLARRAYLGAVYGDHPYGRSVSVESIERIDRTPVLDFWRRHYGAGQAVVALIGSISREQARVIAERVTEGLGPGVPAAALPEVRALTGSSVQRIEHPSTQSHILIGAPGIAWGDPDQFPLLVGNYILGGGGFVSRLYNEVRERRGLAYSVYSYFSLARQRGTFTMGLQTRREQTDVALKVVNDTLESFLRDGPTEQELEAAKANLIGGFALRIDSNRKILEQMLSIGLNGLALDYLDRWRERVQSVTRDQVMAAFARQLGGRSLATVVVGDGAQDASAR